jgi:DNA-binding XRE family transcriptional regulator
MEEIEDIHDARKIASSIAAGEETFPADFVKKLSSGKSRLKVWREYRKLTLAQLARSCGVSIPAISQLENGKRTPRVDLLVKLSKALHCEMEDLV